MLNQRGPAWDAQPGPERSGAEQQRGTGANGAMGRTGNLQGSQASRHIPENHRVEE